MCNHAEIPGDNLAPRVIVQTTFAKNALEQYLRSNTIVSSISISSSSTTTVAQSRPIAYLTFFNLPRPATAATATATA